MQEAERMTQERLTEDRKAREGTSGDRIAQEKINYEESAEKRTADKVPAESSCTAREQKSDREYMAAIEAILFAMGDSVELGKLAAALELSPEKTEKLVRLLQEEMEERQAGIRIAEFDGAFQMCTQGEMFPYLVRIARQPKRYSLTDVMLETLSIIAYKQPVTKAEIEKIRGVSSDHAVNRLVEYGLVKELGRLDAPGRPILFGTTEEFLRCFGVTKIDELPVMNAVQLEEFRQEAEAEMNVKVDV